MLVGVLVVVVDLAADPRRDSDDHRWNGDASDEGDADRAPMIVPSCHSNFFFLDLKKFL